MPHPDDDADFDFDAQLRGLFQEAQQDIESRAATSRKTDESRPAAVVAEPPVAAPEPDAEAAPPLPAPASFPQMLRPLVLGIEAMTRAAGESTAILGKLDRAQSATADAHRALPLLVADLRGILDQKTGLNQRMFDALHEELRGYKDGFLLDSVHRPIIRDIISLYDEVAEIHRQVQSAVGEHRAGKDSEEVGTILFDRMRTLEMNLEHNLHFILEVLARLEVTPTPTSSGKLDKRTQRAVAVELAEEPDEDTVILRTVKCGFLWKERVVRAEEVVIKKYKEGFLVALTPSAPSN